MFSKAEDLAWAAGFFDGEGSTTGTNKVYRRANGNPHHQRQIVLKVGQKYREPLDKMQRVLGGKVLGPYVGRAGDIYVWRMYGTQRVYDALLAMWPYLSVIKRQQAIRRVAIYEGEVA